MRRFLHLAGWDARFQFRYGFYLLYAVMSAFYIAVLSALPAQWRGIAAVALIFSDPAALGLFFMGAIVLLEKSQRVLNALAVSPVRPLGYIAAKCLSLGVVSVLAALVLALAAGVENLPAVLLGTALSSVLFSLLGLIAAAGADSLNRFLLMTVPMELLCFGPGLLRLFAGDTGALGLYPSAFLMDLTAGGAGAEPLGAVIFAVVLGGVFLLARRQVAGMWNQVGGVRI